MTFTNINIRQLALVICCATASGLIVSLNILPSSKDLLLVAFLASIYTVYRFGWTSPYAALPLALSAYILLGIQPWISVINAGQFREQIDADAIASITTIALLSYWSSAPMASYCATRLQITPRTHRRRAFEDQRQSVITAGTILTVIGLIGATYLTVTGGSGLLAPAERSGGVGYIGALSYLLLPGSIMLVATRKSQRVMWFTALGAALVLLASLGYRFYAGATILAAIVVIRQIHSLSIDRLLIILLCLATAAGAVSTYRSHALGQSTFYEVSMSDSGPFASIPGASQLLYTVPREGTAVLGAIINVERTNGPLKGKAQLASLETLLPGDQDDSRTLVSRILYSSSVLGPSLTPSLLGLAYLDFGTTGVIACSWLLGLLLGILFHVQAKRNSLISVVMYAYFLSIALVSVHSGIGDAHLWLIVPSLTLLIYGGIQLLREVQHR